MRRALIAAAESIEPAGDGLQRIRHRLSSPRSMNSLTAAFTEWLRLSGIRFSVRLEPATETGRTALGQVRHLFTGPGLLPGPFLTRGQASGEYPGRRPTGRRAQCPGPPRPGCGLAPAGARRRGCRGRRGRGGARGQPLTADSVHADELGQRAPRGRGRAGHRHRRSDGQPATLGAARGGGRRAAGTSMTQGTKHTLVPAVACSPKASASPSSSMATAASAAPTPTPTPTDTPSATPTPTPSVSHDSPRHPDTHRLGRQHQRQRGHRPGHPGHHSGVHLPGRRPSSQPAPAAAARRLRSRPPTSAGYAHVVTGGLHPGWPSIPAWVRPSGRSG